MFGGIRTRVKEWLAARRTKRERSNAPAESERRKINPHKYDDVLEESDGADPQEPPAWNQRLFF